MTMVWIYAVYLALGAGVTAWVGRTLRRNGPAFAADGEADGERTGSVDALTRLLVIGLYLVSFGVICLFLRTGGEAVDLRSAIEHLSQKVGGVLIVLGMMLFLIVATLANARKQHRQERLLRSRNRDHDPQSDRAT